MARNHKHNTLETFCNGQRCLSSPYLQ